MAGLIALVLVFIVILNRAGARKETFSTGNIIESRFEELLSLEKKYTGVMKWTRRAGNLLSFTQYVIGVVVASSYFQGESSKELIGFLGLMVVVATAIQQRYRPEIRSRKAEKAVTRIRALRRDAQDRLVHHRPQVDVLMLLTHGINRIERDEALDPEIPLSDGALGAPSSVQLPDVARQEASPNATMLGPGASSGHEISTK